jgi:hypothetical protein
MYSFFIAVWSFFFHLAGNWSIQNQRHWRAFRPGLEPLEARYALNTGFTWTGAVDTSWTNKDNWTRSYGTSDYPGKDANDDSVNLTGNPTNGVSLSVNITIGSLRFDPTFTSSLEVVGGKSLTISSGTFTMWAGELNLKGNSSLKLSSSTGAWAGGKLSENGDAHNTIYVYNNSVFSIVRDASRLGADLVIGRDGGNTDTNGTVNFVTNAANNLNNNVTLIHANILNYDKGVINLNQSTSSGTKGGIIFAIPAPGDPTPSITNRGTMSRTVVDDGNPPQTLQISPKVTGLDNSVLVVGDNASINFSNTYEQQSGDYKPGKNSSITGYRQKGGKMSLLNMDTGRSNVYINDSFNCEGGTIEFVNNPGAYTTLNVTGDFSINSSVTLNMNVDGSADQGYDHLGNGDMIAALGTTTVDGATLNITTQNASPQPGWYWSIFHFTYVEGSGWGSLNNSGYSANYQWITGSGTILIPT